jgi:multicomponent Na+:H+ antiporter subunit D
MLSLFLLLPLLGIIILNLPIKIKMQVAALLYVLLLSVGQVIVVLFHPEGFWHRPDFWGQFFKLRLYVDNLTLVLLLSIGITVFSVVLVAWQTITEPKQRLNFINLILISLIGMNGTVLLADIFSLYVFLEVTSVSSFILIAFKRDLNALEGAFKYIILSAMTTVLVLGAIAALLLFSGDTSFASVSQAVKNNNGNVIVLAAMGAFICGLFVKGGLVPFHAWLPDAHSAAPTAVSMLLSGIQIKVLGAYTIIRLVTSVFGYTGSVAYILMVVGTISLVFGALGALGQRDFKRMLAYSSISNMGYIVLGLGCGTALGIAGAVFHLFNHSVFKSLLFANAGAVESRTGTRDMDKMGGLASRMPLTGLTSVLASLSAAGVPPLAGFWSKLIIVMALWMSGYYTYAAIAVLTSIITLAYFLSMQRRVFFGRIVEEYKEVKEVGFGLVFPELILAAITVGVGLFFPLLFNSFIMPVSSFFK